MAGLMRPGCRYADTSNHLAAHLQVVLLLLGWPGGCAPLQRQPPIKETCLVDLMLLSVTTRLDPARLMVSGRARRALPAKPRRPFCRSGRNCAQALKNLQKVRGTKDVHKEFNDMKDAAELAAAVKCVLGC